MLHSVKLPDDTKIWLMYLVNAQMGVLRHSLSLAQGGVTPRSPNFETELARRLGQETFFVHHAEGVAAWVCGKDTVLGFLESFVTCQDGCSASEEELREEKSQLIEAMIRDVKLFGSDLPVGTLEVYLAKAQPLPKDMAIAEACRTSTGELPKWLKSLRSYLEYFYYGLDSIQHDIFPNRGNGGRNENYTRQDFLKAFRRENAALQVCPICDNAAFLTISSDDHIHSDIEHFLPKSIYPHLSVHPLNLIPICKLCNQSLKGDEDPFRPDPDKGHPERYRLEDIALPYRVNSAIDNTSIVKAYWLDNLDEAARSEEENYVVRRGKNGKVRRLRPKSARLKLIPISEQVEVLKTQYKLFARLYDIPGRWEMQVDEVYDTLFRRLRQIFASDLAIERDRLLSSDYIAARLEWLLAYLADTSGTEVYGFPTKWWLAQLLIDYASDLADGLKSPLLEEIRCWREETSKEEPGFRTVAKKIRDQFSVAVAQYQDEQSVT